MNARQLLQSIDSACQMFAKRTPTLRFNATELVDLEASIGLAIEDAWSELEQSGRRPAPVERRLARKVQELRAARLGKGK